MGKEFDKKRFLISEISDIDIKENNIFEYEIFEHDQNLCPLGISQKSYFCPKYFVEDGELFENEIKSFIKLNGNDFIIEFYIGNIAEHDDIIIDELTEDIIKTQIPEIVAPKSKLQLTWVENDYKCWKWKYNETNGLIENEIAEYAIADESNKVVDVLTCSVLEKEILDAGLNLEKVGSCTPVNVVGLTNAKVTKIQKEKIGIISIVQNYKIENDEIVERTDAEKIDELKFEKKADIQNKYENDVNLWFYNRKNFYDQFKKTYPENSTKDAWFVEVEIYWKESTSECENKKSAIDSATTVNEILSISYEPTHVKQKSQLN